MTSLKAYSDGSGTVSGDNLNTFVQSTDLVSDLNNFVGSTGILVAVRGLNAVADGGGGLFYWNATSVGPSDNINVIVPLGSALGAWIRLLPSGAFGPQVSIAAKATTDIGSLGSANVYVTGSSGVTITSFGTSARTLNPAYLLRFDNTATIKNSASIICPGGNDITTSANALYLAINTASGIYVVTPIGGTSGGGGTIYPGFGSQTNLAGAATTDLGSVATHYVNVTGSGASITSFGSSAVTSAPIYLVTFAAANTLTNSAALALITGANITTAAGDSALVSYSGSGNWTMLSYQRADGTPLGASASLHVALITTSTTWTVPAGIVASSQIEVLAIGGGGGGGGAASAAGASASGGSSGCEVIAAFSGFTAGQGVTISPGVAGSGGASTGAGGGQGGTTTVVYNSVTIISAVGGEGGNGSTSAAGVMTGSTGYPISGNVAAAGASGLTLVESNVSSGTAPSYAGSPGWSASSTGISGDGASSSLGCGGNGRAYVTAPGAGIAAYGYGAGGGGACRGTSDVAGGNGSAGAVLIRWVQ